MKKLILAAALCCVSTPALAATKADAMKWEVGYLALSAVDTAQTVDCIGRGQCDEANPLLGKHPSTAKIIAAKLILGGIHFALIDRLANHHPKTALRIAQVSVGLEGTVVALNARFTF